MKCNAKKLCEHLLDRVRTNPPGIVSVMLLNLKSKVNSKHQLRTLICYKKDKKDPGMVLNHCPFCGESLLPYMGMDENGEVVCQDEKKTSSSTSKSRKSSRGTSSKDHSASSSHMARSLSRRLSNRSS